MKKCVITITESETEPVAIGVDNSGFNALEVIGIAQQISVHLVLKASSVDHEKSTLGKEVVEKDE